jgi:hypothetical protein
VRKGGGREGSWEGGRKDRWILFAAATKIAKQNA